MPLSDNAVILMAKNPRPGKVKTRLAKGIGKEKALEVYEYLLQKTVGTICEVDKMDLYIYHSPDIIQEAEWVPSQAQHRLQVKGDLGSKMKAAFREVLKDHKKVIILGADCPLLSAKHIQQAFDKLDSIDVVLGPSEDGGYYLLGMKQFTPSLFDDIEWSQADVFHRTMDRLSNMGKSVFLMEELFDIDHLEDWSRYQKEV